MIEFSDDLKEGLIDRVNEYVEKGLFLAAYIEISTFQFARQTEKRIHYIPFCRNLRNRVKESEDSWKQNFFWRHL